MMTAASQLRDAGPFGDITKLPMLRFLNECQRKYADDHSGHVADYIPELFKANPNHFGIALATIDGHVHEVGDTSIPFTIQSVSKAFVFALALEFVGAEEVSATVGVEPSGEAFNSIRLGNDNRPFNPMVNAGAIATSGLIHRHDPEAAFERVREFLGQCAGRDLDIDMKVYESERDTGHRNRAIAWLLRNNEKLSSDVDAALDVYFRQCSLLVTARDLAVMGATLACNGINPVTGKVVMQPGTVAKTLSVMVSAGMYDFAGEWIFRVGMPAKSGVGGGIVASLPAQFGLGTFSPPLDAQGNSVRGLRACEWISEHFALHMMQRYGDLSSNVVANYQLAHIASRRSRHPSERALLDKHASSARILELAGALNFGSLDYVSRAIAQDQALEMLILDFSRVTAISSGAMTLLKSLVTIVKEAGGRVIISGIKPQSLIEQAFETNFAVEGDKPIYFSNLDDAMIWAEDQIIFRRGGFEHISEGVDLEEQELLLNLKPETLDEIRTFIREETFRTGAKIIEAGSTADSIFFVQKGMVSIKLASGTRLSTLGPGTCFGELALLPGGATRSADVIADTPVTCLTLSLTDYEAVCRKDAAVRAIIMGNLSALVAERLKQANAKIATLTSPNG
ncbi:MAG: glutaminase A [Sphingobium sp.]|jgi:glutaminase|nr:glutaminase A [Sphingobium sp.]MCI1270238.1 glutaminase A [Sphingobium sp.]MCI1757284.1 glutaminase A [Sphingobium sp.]MCI2053308.1 glutaminase A [Sphingobium sp.]